VDRLTLAGTTLRNVPVLIIDDAELTFAAANGYRIHAIIGLPVLRALGRIHMDGTRMAVQAPQPFVAARQNLFAAASDLFLRLRIGGETVPLLLDTGANRSNLTTLFSAAHPHVVSGLPRVEQQVAGAGGARRSAAVTWRDVPMSVAGQTVTLPAINIATADTGSAAPTYGTLGSEALRRFNGYAVDFRAMRLEPDALPR
jgi:hypothetical protein